MKVQAKIHSVLLSMPSSVYLTLLFLIWLIIFFPTYCNLPFMWDDLHLIRAYDSHELKSVLVGHWDPDRVETVAYRPLATFVYHLQGLFLGENVWYQRLFSFLLLFFLCQILILVFKQLGIPKIQVWFTLTILVFSRVFMSLAIWITLSQIIVSYILLLLSVLFFIKSEYTKFKFNSALSIIFFIASLLTREEGYMLPILLFLAVTFSGISKNKRNSYVIAGIMFFLVLVHFYVRHLVAQDYPSNQPFSLPFKNIIFFLGSTCMPGGIISHGWVDNLLKILWILLLILFFWKYISNRDFKKLFLFSAAIIISSLPAFHTPRFFGVMLPSIIAYSIISFTIFSYSSWKGVYATSFRTLVLIVGISAGYSRSLSVIQSFGPNSAYILYYDSVFIYGIYSKVSIPPQRRLEKEARLSKLGVHSQLKLDSIYLAQRLGVQKARNEIIIPKYNIGDF
jgi:hypothetical protein